MKKIFCFALLCVLAGCGDRYSLDERRGPDATGFTTSNPLILPPDYLLRAPEQKQTATPEPAATSSAPATEDPASDGVPPLFPESAAAED